MVDSLPRRQTTQLSRRTFLGGLSAASSLAATGAEADARWPSFRGPGALGVADGHPVLAAWNADPAAGKITGVRWSVPVPGLGHSSPILWANRIYLCSAIRSTAGKAPLKIAPGGEPTAAEDDMEQSWVVLCFDASTGRQLWQQVVRKAPPRATRHEKATHANTTLATDGERLVAFFGSEGLYCYDLDGRLLWRRDLGTINISKYGIGWGYGSSPSIHGNRIALLCDDPANPFLAVFRLSDGEPLWRVSRKGVSERSWATPLIYAGANNVQVIANGWPWIVSYDLETGKELWRLEGGGDNPIPTPFVSNGWIYITNAHGGKAPIYVIRPGARGDISLPDGAASGEHIVWASAQAGSYISTPVVYGDYLYLGNSNGVVRCLESKTGKKMFEQRLAPDAQIYASLVAADGKVFCPSLDGDVYVLKAGPSFDLLARNHLGAPCFATPLVWRGILYFRTTESLVAVG